MSGKLFLFKIPLEVAIYTNTSEDQIIRRIMIDQKQENYSFELQEEPIKVILDPNTKVLMKSDFIEISI